MPSKAHTAAARRVQIAALTPQARFWGKFQTSCRPRHRQRHCQDRTGRKAKIRLRLETNGQIRRKHGCGGGPRIRASTLRESRATTSVQSGV